MLPTKPLVIAFVILAVCYYLFGKDYQKHLKETYNYNMIGFPTIVAIAGPVLQTLMAWGGVGNPDDGAFAIILKMLLFATPGVILATVVCLAKTKDLKIVVINALLLYVVAVVAGGSIAVAIMAVVAWFLIRQFGAEGARTMRGGDRAGSCPRCGTKVSGAGTCPGCGVELR